MSPAMQRYREWEQRLIILRTRTGGHYSPDEDRIVNAMTAAWEEMTPAEQTVLDEEGPRAPNRLAVDVETESAVAARWGWPSPSDVRPRFSMESHWPTRAIRYATKVVNLGLERWSDQIVLDSLSVRRSSCT